MLDKHSTQKIAYSALRMKILDVLAESEVRTSRELASLVRGHPENVKHCINIMLHADLIVIDQQGLHLSPNGQQKSREFAAIATRHREQRRHAKDINRLEILLRETQRVMNRCVDDHWDEGIKTAAHELNKQIEQLFTKEQSDEAVCI